MPLTAKQQEALELLHQQTFTALGGGSRSGKTYLLVYLMIVRGIRTPSRHLIVRRFGTDVKNSIWFDTLPKVIRNEFPKSFQKECTYNKGELKLTFPSEGGGLSEIWLGGLDDSRGTDRILGMEFSTIMLNECSEFLYKTVGILKTRLAEKTILENRMWFDMNPPNTAHWSYKVFIKGIDPLSRNKLSMKYGYMKMVPSDNIDNLPAHYLKSLDDLPRSEKIRFLSGEFAEASEDALFQEEWFDKYRAKYKVYDQVLEHENISQIVIGVDPAITSSDDSDLTGIVAMAKTYEGHYFVIADWSMRAKPLTWAKRVMKLYELLRADLVVGETNQGGDMVEETLRSAGYSGKYEGVRASRSKFARAEPLSAMYEKGHVHHLDDWKAMLPLEEEMAGYVKDLVKKSPDRLDAAVWAFTYMQPDSTRLENFANIDMSHYT